MFLYYYNNVFYTVTMQHSSKVTVFIPQSYNYMHAGMHDTHALILCYADNAEMVKDKSR